MELQEALDKFMRKKKIERIAPESMKNYEYNLLTFKNFYSGRVDDLTEDDIDDYILYLQEETELKLTTINNKIRDLRAFLNYCYKQKFISERFEIKLLRMNEPDIIPFEEQQLKAIYDACLNVDNGKINYLGLQLCIEHCVPVGRVLNAIRQEVMREEKEPQVHIPVSNEEMSVILALHEKGLSCAEIAKHLGHKDRTRVAGALSRYQKKQSV